MTVYWAIKQSNKYSTCHILSKSKFNVHDLGSLYYVWIARKESRTYVPIRVLKLEGKFMKLQREHKYSLGLCETNTTFACFTTLTPFSVFILNFLKLLNYYQSFPDKSNLFQVITFTDRAKAFSPSPTIAGKLRRNRKCWGALHYPIFLLSIMCILPDRPNETC